MQKLRLLALLLVATGLLALINSRNESSHREQIRSNFYTDLQLTSYAIQNIEKLCKEEAGQVELKKAFLESRLAFKRCESFIAYYDDTYYNQLNGANLKKIDKTSTQYSEIEAHGFQVIEELVSDEITNETRQLIVNECIEMGRVFSRIAADKSRFTFYDREIMECHQQEVIRINALGLTGFDSPVMHYSLQESEAALHTLAAQLELMKPLAKTSIQQEAIHRAVANANASAKLLDNADFNSFDRMEFVKNQLNPLFRKLMELQELLKIETYAQTFGMPGVIDQEARDLYADNMVNRFFFLLTPAEQTNRI